MTTSNSSNRHTSTTDDTILNAASYSISAASALYYPSLIGNSWDDELLPSGD
jgi:hypothetical protein